MALIEKTLADELVDLRLQMSLGTAFVPAADLERALQRNLDLEQAHRFAAAAVAAIVGFEPKAET